MKLSRRFLPLQLIFLALQMIGFVRSGQAQDRVVFKDGRVQDGKVVGTVISPTQALAQIQVGTNTLSFPLANIAQVTMAVPAEYTAGLAAYESRDFVKALVGIKGAVSRFKGLPLDWVREATAKLGDIYLANNDTARAEEAYKEFQRLYPGAGGRTMAVGMARIALAKKDSAAAKAALEPIVDQALKEKNPAKDALAAYGQAFFLSGQIKEAEGDLPGALEDYLRTVTLFPADRVTASAALEKADALRKQKAVIVP